MVKLSLLLPLVTLIEIPTALSFSSKKLPNALAVPFEKYTRLHLKETPQVEESKLPSATLGALVLLSVPISWGTFAPVVKYVYDINIPGFLFSAAYYLVAVTTLTTLNTIFQEESNSSVTRGGIELGSYLFLGNAFQVIGLQTIPADRAAFLVQLTTVFVPLYQVLFNQKNVSAALWLACLLAFSGVVAMEIDPSLTDSMSIIPNIVFERGDLLIILAAFAYTLHVVRLDKYAKDCSPLQLAAAKSMTEAVLSVALVVGLISIPPCAANQDLISFFGSTIDYTSSSSLAAIGAILWTGIVTCAYTIFAQSFGQSRLQNPVLANLIYSSQPIFSSAFAYFLLGEEMTKYGLAGGVLIGLALALVSIDVMEEN